MPFEDVKPEYYKMRDLLNSGNNAVSQLQNANALQGSLWQQYTKGNPLIDQQRALGMRNINRNADQSRRLISSRLADSGLSGALGVNLYNDVTEGQNAGISQLETGLAQQQQAYMQDIIRNLLGIDQMRTGAFNSDRQFGLDVNSQILGIDRAMEEIKLEREKMAAQQNQGTMGGLGQLGSSGAQAYMMYLLTQGAPAAATASDRRVKKDIEPSTYGLDEVMKLEPVTFVYTNDESERKEIGFIAQDVKKLVPEVVHGSEEYNDILRIAYGNLGAVLVKAIQEQQEMIQALRSEVEELKAVTAAVEGA